MNFYWSKLGARRVVLGAALVGQLGVGAVVFGVGDAQAQDWEVQSGAERQQEIVRRYLEMLEKSPSEGFVFDKVLEYVGRGKGLDNLIKDYQKKVETKPQQLNYRLILGHLLKAKNDYEGALEQYDKAVELGEKNPTAWLSRGSAHMLLQQQKEATADFEKALELEKNRDKKQEILRNLADASFAQHDWDRAEKYYDQLVEMSPRDEYLRMEYAQVLMKYRRYEKALEQYDALLKIAGKDAKKRATTLRDKGEVLDQMARSAEALRLYEQAMGLMRPGNWLYSDLQQRVIGAYRNMDRLDELLADLSKKWRAPTYEQSLILGDLYDELGDEDQALKFYRLASSKNRREVNPRLKVIEILKRRGEDQAVVKAYQELLTVAGNQHRFHFELVQLYFRLGEHKKAEQVLIRIQSRFSRDPVVYLELADTYMRFDMLDKAQAAYERLVRMEPKNPSYILSLGEFYYQQGEVEKAKETWQKLAQSHLEPYESYSMLGDTFAEHGMVEQGISYYQKAVELAPDNLEVRQGLALNFVRARRWEEAVEVWEQVLEQADSAELRAQARGRIISIHEQRGVLGREIEQWQRAFEAEEADIEAGYFLAESYIHRRDYQAAEQAYQQLIDLDSRRDEDDIDAMSSLLRVYQQTGQSEKAIGLLEELAELRPALAGEYFRQITDLAVKLYQDDKAVDYARRAVEQNPDDAQARVHLGDVYRQMERYELAIDEYQAAADLDARALEPVMKLAELYMKLGEFEKADQFYRRVVKRADDEGLILDAGRAAIRLASAENKLDELEIEFSPLVFQARAKPVYRKLMLEIYDLMITPLAQQFRYGVAPAGDESGDLPADNKSEQTAAAKLERVARSSMPVLLDALHSKDIGERALAVELLGQVGAGAAAPSLARMAVDPQDSLAGLAAISVAMLADARASNILVEALDHRDPGVRDVAAWALGFTGGQAASTALAGVLNEGQNDSQRDLAALSLGRIGDETAVRALTKLATFSGDTPSGDTPGQEDAADGPGAWSNQELPSSAIIWAFGEAQVLEAVALLRQILESGAPHAQDLAASSLARVHNDEAFEALVDAFWSSDATRREAARRGLVQWSALDSSRPDERSQRDNERLALDEIQFVDTIKNEVSTQALMAQLHERIRVVRTGSDLPDALWASANHEKIAEKLKSDDPTVQRLILEDLRAALKSAESSDRDGNRAGDNSSDARRVADLKQALAVVQPQLAEMSKTSSLTLLRPVSGLLAFSGNATDYQRVSALAADKDPRIRALAMEALADALALGAARPAEDAKLQALFETGMEDADFAVRAAATAGLGYWAKAQKNRAGAATQQLLNQLNDQSNLVRQAAARGLIAIASDEAFSGLGAYLSTQPIVVQLAALRALAYRQEPAAQKVLQRYKDHSDIRLRQAATITQ